MKPSEMAKQIFDKYQNHYYVQITIDSAKEYSLIAVEYVLMLANPFKKPFWEKVKDELMLITDPELPTKNIKICSKELKRQKKN
jgi:hypothetical protein